MPKIRQDPTHSLPRVQELISRTDKFRVGHRNRVARDAETETDSTEGRRLSAQGPECTGTLEEFFRRKVNAKDSTGSQELFSRTDNAMSGVLVNKQKQIQQTVVCLRRARNAPERLRSSFGPNTPTELELYRYRGVTRLGLERAMSGVLVNKQKQIQQMVVCLRRAGDERCQVGGR
ncbi:hypothetical protein K438DRAFT_1748513 [Mycena galopus ATCC 62051]|nr:hypothetical protein K438DRAFT_1748513 [Mycena galopus ATCC 62051]